MTWPLQRICAHIIEVLEPMTGLVEPELLVAAWGFLAHIRHSEHLFPFSVFATVYNPSQHIDGVKSLQKIDLFLLKQVKKVLRDLNKSAYRKVKILSIT